MSKPRPLVQVAAICESVIVESDRVASIIRIVDTFYLTLPKELPPGEVGAVQLKAFVSLKSGDVTGEYDVDLVLKTPSGKQAITTQKWHINLTGSEQGATAQINFTLPVKEFGLYWYEVVWEGEVLTRIPFKLVDGPKPEAEERVAQNAELG